NMNATLFAAKDGVDQTSLRALAFKQNPPEPWHVTLNKPEWRVVEIASGNGHGNARVSGAEAQRLMSQVMMIFAAAPALAPVVGGWILQWGPWPWIFWFVGAYGVVAALLVVLV